VVAHGRRGLLFSTLVDVGFNTLLGPALLTSFSRGVATPRGSK
jgi:hypothetical protein